MTVPAEQQGGVSRSITSFLAAAKDFQRQESGGSMDSGKEQRKPPEPPKRNGIAGQTVVLKAAARFKKLPIPSEKTQTGLPASQLQASGSQDQSPFDPDLPDLGVQIRSSGAAQRGSILHGIGSNSRAHVLQALGKQSTLAKEHTAAIDVADGSASVPGVPEHIPKSETAMRTLVKPPGSSGLVGASPRKKSVYQATAAFSAMEAEVEQDAGSSFLEVKKIDPRQLSKD
jgi:hypothetical protein